MTLQNKHLGSTMAIVIGSLMIAVVIAAAGQGENPGTSLEGGIAAILGAIAYRSAKRRKLGLIQKSVKNIFVEGIGLSAAVLLLVLGITVAHKAAFETPLGLVIIPLWVIAAYLAILLYDPKDKKDASFFQRNKPWLIALLFFFWPSSFNLTWLIFFM